LLPLASCHASPCVSLNYVELFQHLFPPHHSQLHYSNGFNCLNSHSTPNFSTIVDGLRRDARGRKKLDVTCCFNCKIITTVCLNCMARI
jgi:hypothetical protein